MCSWEGFLPSVKFVWALSTQWGGIIFFIFCSFWTNYMVDSHFMHAAKLHSDSQKMQFGSRNIIFGSQLIKPLNYLELDGTSQFFICIVPRQNTELEITRSTRILWFAQMVLSRQVFCVLRKNIQEKQTVFLLFNDGWHLLVLCFLLVFKLSNKHLHNVIILSWK